MRCKKDRLKGSILIASLFFIILSCTTKVKQMHPDRYKINDKEVSKEAYDSFKKKLTGPKYAEYCDEPIDDENGSQGFFQQDIDGNEYDVSEQSHQKGLTQSIYFRSPSIRTSEFAMINLEQRNIIDEVLKAKGDLSPGSGDFSIGIDEIKKEYLLKLTPSQTSSTIIDLEIGPKEGNWYFTCQIDIKERKLLNPLTETSVGIDLEPEI